MSESFDMIPPVLLRNARIIDPVNGIDEQADLLIHSGKIKELASFIQEDRLPEGVQEIDLTGKIVCPGFIDMHVHLREPGEEYKETIQSGTMAAAAGGFTAVACMPNTNPVNDNEAVTALILAKAKTASARVYPVGAISKGSDGSVLAEFGEMKRAGVVAVSDDGRPVVNSQLMRRALEYAANYDLLVISHSEEASLSLNGVMNESVLSTRLGLRGTPRVSEEIMVYRDLALAAYTGQPLHVAHVSTRESVSLVRRAKEKGWPVTAETAPHYFSLTEEAVGQYDTSAKMNPPLRSGDDVEAIRQGLADGAIDVIATDHAPHSALEKDVEFNKAANGVIGMETAVSLGLKLVQEGVISITGLVEKMAAAPARILGLEKNLQPGGTADITIIDPDILYEVDVNKFQSLSKNCPFDRWQLTGKPVLTMVGGRVVFEQGFESIV